MNIVRVGLLDKVQELPCRTNIHRLRIEDSLPVMSKVISRACTSGDGLPLLVPDGLDRAPLPGPPPKLKSPVKFGPLPSLFLTFDMSVLHQRLDFAFKRPSRQDGKMQVEGSSPARLQRQCLIIQ